MLLRRRKFMTDDIAINVTRDRRFVYALLVDDAYKLGSFLASGVIGKARSIGLW
jgi:hypothetical protein